MDLFFGPEYAAVRDEVKQFLSENLDKQPAPGARLRSPEALAWQKLLIENGYHSRTIPRAYGGYGAEPDSAVDNDPPQEYAGIDQQLNKAIEVILEELKTQEKTIPPLPPYPVK